MNFMSKPISKIELSDANKYLAWAKGFIADILAKESEDGLIERIRAMKKP